MPKRLADDDKSARKHATPTLTTVVESAEHGPLVLYQRAFLGDIRADKLFTRCAALTYRQEEVKIFGKRHTPGRRVCSYAAAPQYAHYRYAGKEETAEAPWPHWLAKLAERVRAACASPHEFNYVLVNEYAGADGVGAHADDEGPLVRDAAIASVSVGRRRRFVLHPMDGGRAVGEVLLRHGDLAVMQGACQRVLKHSVPRITPAQLERDEFPAEAVVVNGEAIITYTRYNLTFRVMKPANA